MNATAQQQPRQSTPKSTGSQTSRYNIKAKVSSAKDFAQLISTLLFKNKEQYATFEISSAGMKMISEEDKVFQVSAFMNNSSFVEYIYNADIPLRLRVNISSMAECLHFYAKNLDATALHLSYPGLENTINLLLLFESDKVTDCGIKTTSADESLDFGYKNHFELCRIVFKAESFRESLAELCSEYLQSERIVFEIVEHALQPSEPNGEVPATICKFSMRTDNSSATAKLVVNFPQSGSECIYKFTLHPDLTNVLRKPFSYQVKYLKHLLKGLQNAETVCIRINQQGTLHATLSLKESKKHVDYYINSNLVEADDGQYEEEFGTLLTGVGNGEDAAEQQENEQ